MIQEELKPKPTIKSKRKNNRHVKTLEEINNNNPKLDETQRSIKHDFIKIKNQAKRKSENIHSPSIFSKLKNKVSNAADIFLQNIGRLFTGLRYPYFKGNTGINNKKIK